VANLPGLVLKIGADTKGAIDGLNKVNRAIGQSADSATVASKRWEAVAPKLKLLGAAAAAAGAAVAINFGRQAVDAASSLNESISKTNVVFGTSSAAIRQWAESSATDFLMSKQAALEAAGTYGNLFQAFGIGQSQAAEMSTTLVELAADLSSFNDIEVQDAIDAIRSGLSGEAEPLKRLGVALTDARMKQEALNMGIYDGKGILDANQKAQAAYALILKDTTLAQGDVARTADSYANQMRALEAATANASATIGGGLMTGLQSFSRSLGGPDGLVNLIDQAADGLANVTAGVGTLAGALGTLEVDAVKPLAERERGNFFDFLSNKQAWSGPFQALALGIGIIGENARISDAAMADLTSELERAAYMRDVYAGATAKSNYETRDEAKYANEAAAAINALTGALERRNAANQSRIAANIRLRQLRADGPRDLDGDKKISRDERRSFGLDYASTVSQKYDSLVAEGRLVKARQVLAGGREQLRDFGLSAGFAKSVLGTPPELREAIEARRNAKAEAGANEWRQSMATVFQIDQIVVNADTPAEAVEKAKRWARLDGLGRGGPVAPIGDVVNPVVLPGAKIR
jgi:hypothetical protein